MSDKPASGSEHHEPRRGRIATDDSLRDERVRADTELAKNRATVNQVADDVIRVARARADALVDGARVATDRAADALSGAHAITPETNRDRTAEDAVVERERAAADTKLDRERRATDRSLGCFLDAERIQTDERLGGERLLSDEVIAGRDNFLGIVSHDLRGMLTTLSLASQLAAKGIGADESARKARAHAATADKLIARMARVLDDLLDITSIEAGRLAIIRAADDANSLVSEIVAAFTPLADAKGITLEARLATAPLVVELDHGRILQVLANLVSNAVRFTPNQGTIVVGIEASGNEARFSVSDTGAGIAAEQLEAVFERFRQLSRDRRGLGLGLHISKCIVETHGGRIWAQSALDAGSTFHFTIPKSAVSPSLLRETP
jgi:signal transduction histidine kinase